MITAAINAITAILVTSAVVAVAALQNTIAVST
jgi:hypothetical protein